MTVLGLVGRACETGGSPEGTFSTACAAAGCGALKSMAEG
jgi:hypothetical protein